MPPASQPPVHADAVRRAARRALATLGAVGMLALHAARAQDPAIWVSAWQACAQSIPQGPDVPAWRKAAALHGQTVREILVPELSGDTLRVRIDNAWSDRPLRVGAASVGLVRRGAALRPDSLAMLRFGGSAQALIAPGGQIWSDPLPWRVRAGQALALSLYLPDPSLPRSWHRLAGQVQYVSGVGDHTTDAAPGAFVTRLTSYLWLDRLDVRPRGPAAALVAIGDSITDGMRSTLDARRSWPQQLGARLRAAGVRDLAVLNAGISGNRLLSDSPCWGAALRERFARDALRVAGVRVIVVLIGINDIDFADTPRRRGLDCDAPHLRPTAAELEQALAELARRAHARGVRIDLGTLTPANLPPAREALRQQLNTWIRGSGDFDAVVDFDAALRDPMHPQRMLARLDSGDHLHPSDAGYAAMADAVLPLARREAERSSASHLRASASSASSTGASSAPRAVSE